MVTLTPEARNSPPKRLLKIWLPSSVAVAWLVISIPGEEKENQHHEEMKTETLVAFSKLNRNQIQTKLCKVPRNIRETDAIFTKSAHKVAFHLF